MLSMMIQSCCHNDNNVMIQCCHNDNIIDDTMLLQDDSVMIQC